MKLALKNQILLRMLGLLLVTTSIVTAVSIRVAITNNRRAELGRLTRIVNLASATRFPLTSNILENMKSLSQAEFAFVSDGEVVSETDRAPTESTSVDWEQMRESNQDKPADSSHGFSIDGSPYYHAAITNLSHPVLPSKTGDLHIFVPREEDSKVWWRAAKPPIITAFIVLPFAFVASLALAAQVTRPVATLEKQVSRIANGDLQTIPLPRASRELHSLNHSINEMVVKMQDHEEQLLKNEQLKVMVQFGSGIAHNLRNAATGCKMAIELLAVDDSRIAEKENFQVASRQLTLMNEYIKKFLLLAKTPVTQDRNGDSEICLADVLDEVIFLLRPTAEHLKVQLEARTGCSDTTVNMQPDDAKQLMMNLISNAITAASEAHPLSSGDDPATVNILLNLTGNRLSLIVADNGNGPPDEIQETIFEPFVTGSPEGTGLGLSLVKEIANRSGGQIDWTRGDRNTTFIFSMPLRSVESETNP